MKDKHYYIVGLGRTGLSTARFLKKQGVPFVVWDDNPQSRQDFIEAMPDAVLEDPEHHVWRADEVLLLSPGIAHQLPFPHPAARGAAHAGVPLHIDVEIFCHLHQNTIILGITGTNGKSTTTALVHHILTRSGYPTTMGGNIGIPILDLEPSAHSVLELSSYQLERMHTPALSGALLLNITPDHLERHGSMESYQQAKGRIFTLLKDKGVGAISLDDPYCRGLYEEGSQGHSLLPFSVSTEVPGGVYRTGTMLINHLALDAPYAVMDLATVPYLKGTHNHQNIIGAYTLLKGVFDISDEDFQSGVLTFPGLAHRQEHVGSHGSLTFINDSKATNLDSALQALQAFDHLYWLVGGMAKSDTIDENMIRPYAPKIRHIYAYGRDRALFLRDLRSLCGVTVVETLEEAVRAAYKDAEGEGVILLSPACASWDQFRSFEHRGDVFRSLAKQLMEENDG